MVKVRKTEGTVIVIKKYISPIALVVLFVLFAAINSSFIKMQNISDILQNIAPLLTVALGAMFVLLTGSIDLSVGSIVSCASVLIAVTVPYIGALSYAAAIAFGVLAGALNGFLYTKIKAPSFIITLGTMGVWQSVAYLLSPAAVIINRKDWGIINWGKISFSLFSIPFLISILLVVIFLFVLKRTATGKSIYAVGANEAAARLAGIDVNRIKLKAFLLSGLCCSISAIFLVIKFRSGSPTVGANYTLLSIAAVCLGGIPLSGGKGNSFGTLLGAMLVLVIQNGMTIVAVNAYWEYIVFGLLMIASMYITTDRSKRELIVK